MRKRNGIIKFLFVSLLLFLPLLITNLQIMNSTHKQMDKIYIYVTELEVNDYLDYTDSEWYEMRFIPEYKRLFGYYGDRLQNSDSDYEDWYGREYVYPPGIVYYPKTYTNNLQIEYSYCLEFSDSTANELYIGFKLIKHIGAESSSYTIGRYFGDNENYGTYYLTDYLNYLVFGGGQIKVKLKIVLM